MTFDDLLNEKATVREKLLYDAGTTEVERKDFRNAFNALKDCLGMSYQVEFICHTYIACIRNRLFSSWW